MSVRFGRARSDCISADCVRCWGRRPFFVCCWGRRPFCVLAQHPIKSRNDRKARTRDLNRLCKEGCTNRHFNFASICERVGNSSHSRRRAYRIVRTRAYFYLHASFGILPRLSRPRRTDEGEQSVVAICFVSSSVSISSLASECICFRVGSALSEDGRN